MKRGAVVESRQEVWQGYRVGQLEGSANGANNAPSNINNNGQKKEAVSRHFRLTNVQ